MGKWKPKGRPGQRGTFNPEEADLGSLTTLLAAAERDAAAPDLGAPRVPAAPGMATRLDAWRGTLVAFWKERIWKEAPPGVAFHFQGGSLDGAVAIAMRDSQQGEAILLYANIEDFARDEIPESDEELNDPPAPLATAVVLQLEPQRVVSRADREACARAGLIIGGNRCVRLFESAAGTPRPAAREDADRMLDAVRGILALWTDRLEDIVDGLSADTTFLSVSGETMQVSVAAVEDDEDGLTGGANFPVGGKNVVFWGPRPAFGTGADTWCLVRVDRANFVEARDAFESVERFHWERHESECFRLSVWLGGEDQGDLAHPAGADVDSFRDLIKAGQVELVIIEGGPHVNWWSERDVLWQKTVLVTGLVAATPPRPVRTPSARRRT